MSRRRFFNPSTTYHSFIQTVDEYKAHIHQPLPNAHDPLLREHREGMHDVSARLPHHTHPSHIMEEPLALAVTAASVPSRPWTSPSVDIWLSRRNLDAVVKRKSLLVFLNGMLGVALTVVLLQVGWDTNVDPPVFRSIDLPGALPILFSLKVASALSTLLLLYQLLDRKRLQVSIKYRDKRRKARHMLHKPAVSLLSLLSLRPSTFRLHLWTQILICAWHPSPLFDLLGFHLSNKWGLLMILRFHLVFRVIRDWSDIWLNRRSIAKQIAITARTPNFDWYLSVKTLLYRRPIALAVSFYLLCILVFGYMIYIFEREAQPDLVSLPIGFFLAYQCITIDWASDVYDVYNPRTWAGKLTCLSAAMMGLLLTSFIIGIVSQSVMPSKFEETALNCISVEQAREQEREQAARLIQFVWRNHRHEKELEEKLAQLNPRLYEEISILEEKEFMEEFMARTKLLRNTRRQRIDLEEQLSLLAERSESLHRSHGDMRINNSNELVLSELQRIFARQNELMDMLRLNMSVLQERTNGSSRRSRKRVRGSSELNAVEGESGTLGYAQQRHPRRSRTAEHMLTLPESAQNKYASDSLSHVNPAAVLPSNVVSTHSSSLENKISSGKLEAIEEHLNEKSSSKCELGEQESIQSGSLVINGERRRRVRSLSPHSAALAEYAISAMSSGRRRADVSKRRASVSIVFR